MASKSMECGERSEHGGICRMEAPHSGTHRYSATPEAEAGRADLLALEEALAKGTYGSDQIRSLRAEAKAAGDDVQAALCTAALAGDEYAMGKCVAAILSGQG